MKLTTEQAQEIKDQQNQDNRTKNVFLNMFKIEFFL